MSSLTKVAVVTGSNRGIGHSIVKGLSKAFNGTVYLTGTNDFEEFSHINLMKKYEI